MKIVNKRGAPDWVYRAALKSKYDNEGSDYTATSAIRPVYMVALEREHYDRIEIDVSDMGSMLVGTAIHTFLETAYKDEPGYHTEERLFLNHKGLKISGQYDLYVEETQRIVDYKSSTKGSFTRGIKREWVEQLNILAVLARANGMKVAELGVGGWMTDWNAFMRLRGAHKNPFPGYDIELWGEKEAKAFLALKIKEHEATKKKKIKDVKPCTPEERYADPVKWAVRKEGADRAKRLHPSKELADVHATYLNEKEKGTPWSVEKREPQSIRCQLYCNVSKFCPEYKRWKRENGLRKQATKAV